MDPDTSESTDDGPSLRDTLESSIEQHAPEGGEGGDSQVAPDPGAAPEPVEKAAKGDRDALGRFLPKAGEKPQEGQEAPQAGPGTPGATQPVQGQPAPIQGEAPRIARAARQQKLARRAEMPGVDRIPCARRVGGN